MMKYIPNRKFAFYNRFDEDFSSFLIDLLHSLEPVQLTQGQILLDEHDEVEEVIFLRGKLSEHGNTYKFFVGFNVTTNTYEMCEKHSKFEHIITDKRRYFPIKYGPCRPIGDYNVTYDTKSDFIYKIEHNCQALFIRRSVWRKLLEKSASEIVDSFKNNI